MTNIQMPKHAKVLIIGGGPAGSITASLLAQEGIDVVVCEKEKFPRYHIGESLLPSMLPIFEFIGLREELDNYGFEKKYGARWKMKKDLPEARTNFRSNPIYNYSYHVVRSEFDELLLNFSKKKGATVFQETTITEILFEDSKPVRARWKMKDGSTDTISFDFLIDASGLSGIMSNRYLKNRKQQPNLANVAICKYWKNFVYYRDAEGVEHPGEFVMNAIEDGSGWVWAIPLHNGTLSTGVVLSQGIYDKLVEQNLTLEQIYSEKINLTPLIKKLLDNATTDNDIKYWNDYSYFSEHYSGENFRLVGDAAAFLDPLISTGVHIAAMGAISTAATVCAVIKNECPPQSAAAFHDEYIRRLYSRYLLVVLSLYQQINQQEEIVLHGISGNMVQSVFDQIQPMLTGNFDMEYNQMIPEQKSKTMASFLKSLMEKESYLKVVEKSTVLGEGFDQTSALNGYFINFKKGSLGLKKI